MRARAPRFRGESPETGNPAGFPRILRNVRRAPLDFSSGTDLSDGSGSVAEAEREEFALRLVRSLPRLRWHAMRRVGPGRADDVVQETLVRALQSSATHDGGRSVWPWLRSVADNVAARQAEREARAPEATDDIDGTATDTGAHVDGPSDNFREEAARLIDHLRGPEREALERHYLGGESVANIADATGAAIGTVKARLSRGRRRLVLLFGATAGALAALFTVIPRGTGEVQRPPRIFHASFVIEHLTPAEPQFARTIVAPQSTDGWRIKGARPFSTSAPKDIETGRLEPR